jgi:dTDP-glucose 4,6-dehydratase
MNLLVTGGAGFIGSNFIRYILKNHPTYKVINFDNLTYAGNLDSLKDVELNPNYRFVKGDIADAKRVDETIKTFRITHIVNFAAETHVDRSILGPQEFIRTNVVGTQVLLDAALKNNVKRFHHISTDEVFGALPLNTEDKFDEATRYDPKSPYSASKAASDHLVRAYHATYGLPVTITNSSNNYGPFMNPEKFLPRSITNLIEGQKIPIYGDGKYVRDWLYVEDHCRAIDMILQKPSLGEKGETFLLGGQIEDLNNLEVAKKVLRAFGKNEKFIKHVKDRPGHDRRYAVNWEKAKKELGWRPKHDFDTWVERTVEWYKQNEWWWRPLKEKAEALYERTDQK